MERRCNVEARTPTRFYGIPIQRCFAVDWDCTFRDRWCVCGSDCRHSLRIIPSPFCAALLRSGLSETRQRLVKLWRRHLASQPRDQEPHARTSFVRYLKCSPEDGLAGNKARMLPFLRAGNHKKLKCIPRVLSDCPPTTSADSVEWPPRIVCAGYRTRTPRPRSGIKAP